MTYGLFPILVSASLSLHCPLEHSVYDLRGARDVTAHFYPRMAGNGPFQSNVTLSIHSAKTSHTYEFVPFEEGAGAGLKSHLALEKGRGEASIEEASNLLGTQVEYFFANAHYTAMQAYTPALGAEAPPHLFVPGLQELFWYADTSNREAVPISFFDRVSCSR